MIKKIGRFEVRGELGRGAQSVVYLAFDPQLQREIAIKTLQGMASDSVRSQALLVETRTVSQLHHPNILPILDSGAAEGDPFIVFEYVPGKTLAEFLKLSGALPSVKAVTSLRRILDAIAHAHAAGVIHRDLKPSNILLDEDGIPKVMDFGIVVHVGADKALEEYTGTPAYMAPEYIDRREISERTDVFAAGLVFFEMLSGQSAIRADNVFQIMHRIANEDIRLPAGVAVDERLAAILYKSLARNPDLRYQTAVQFAEALDNYLDPEEDARRIGEGKQATLEFLLRRMRHKSDFPALSESVSAINKIANSETESVNKLFDSILKDFSLTNKLLRLVNSVYYRPAGGGTISTVSRAIVVLGFEAVRNIAVTVLLFEHLQDKAHANQLKEEFLRTNLSAILAKDLCTKAQMRDLEQTFICALFHGLGRLLSQYYFPEESDQVRRLVGQTNCTEDQAAVKVLGLSFEELGLAIAKQWGFPTLIISAMRKLPSGPVHKAATQEERLRVLSGFANELCSVIAFSTPESQDKELKKVMARFSEAMTLSQRDVMQTVQHSVEEVGAFARIIHLNTQQTHFGKQMTTFAKVGSGEGSVSEVEKTEGLTSGLETVAEADGCGIPEDAQAILTAGIQDISNTLVEDFKLTDILRIILETMYRAMGFKRVVLCIRDPKAGCMQGRFGFGPGATDVAKAFRFPLSFTPDVFHAATSKGVDILISDIDDPKIANRIPDWYRMAVPARSLILFPLNVKGNAVALIYADRDQPGGINIPEKELSLLRTLRNQAVLAIKQGG